MIELSNTMTKPSGSGHKYGVWMLTNLQEMQVNNHGTAIHWEDDDRGQKERTKAEMELMWMEI